MKKVLFIKNTLILTATALILRLAGIFFRVWMASAIGAEGMGLYQVIISVYVLASTFATSGICTAVTRIVTERLSLGDRVGARRTLSLSIIASLIIAALTSLIIISFAKPISLYLINDIRAKPSIKILCISLPFIGICSCIRGYFFAKRSSIPPSICQILEQAVRMLVIVLLVKKYSGLGMSATTAAVVFGDCVAEAVGTISLCLIFKLDFSRLKTKSKDAISRKAAFKELFRIATPISAGRYLHTALRTAENLLTPTCLSKYSGSKSTALSEFGMIKGMALPLLLFPASLLSAVSTLLVPEMSEAVANKNNRSIKAAVEKVFYITAIISFLIGGVFFTTAKQVGIAVYKSDSVGYLIKALAPLVPFMYIDLIGDGILKGLDQQGILLRNNVLDSTIRIFSVIIFVSKFGMQGFLGVMFFSNIFTGVLSVIRIVKVTEVKFNSKIYFLRPLFSAITASAITDYLCKGLQENAFLYIIVCAISITIIYFLIMVLCGGINLNPILDKVREKTKK